MKPWQKERQEQDELIRNMQKLSQPDFYSYFKLISQPPYNEIEIKREATLSEAEYKSAVPPAEEGYDDINAVFPAVVTIPLQKTLHYWSTHHAPDSYIDKELLSPNDIPTDLVDVYEYLCSLDKTERNNTYKRADLHPVLISKIEASVSERSLDEFSSIIASNLQDTKVLLHLLSTMQRIMPFSSFDELANWPAEDLKGYLQSLDFTQAIDETFQKHLHLPQNERDEAIAKAIYSYTGSIVAKYYDIQHLMSSEEQAIVDGIIYNPLFPLFIQYCKEIEGSIVEQEQPEPQTVKQQTTSPLLSKPKTFDELANDIVTDLHLPDNFFDLDNKDTSIETIAPIKEPYKKAKPFADMINILANNKYIEPQLGNRRKLASVLSGRRVDGLENYTEPIKWKTKMALKHNQTEQVMLWICRMLYGGYNGNYEKAYTILNMKQSLPLKKGNITSYAVAPSALEKDIRDAFVKKTA